MDEKWTDGQMAPASGVSLQLDYPSVISWDLVGTTSKLGPISNLRSVLDSSTQTTQGNVLDFFRKT